MVSPDCGPLKFDSLFRRNTLLLSRTRCYSSPSIVNLTSFLANRNLTHEDGSKIFSRTAGIYLPKRVHDIGT
jgi:hypothetical protein